MNKKFKKFEKIFWKITTNWKFWVILYFSLVLILFLIGFISEMHSLSSLLVIYAFFPQILLVILFFPMGIVALLNVLLFQLSKLLSLYVNSSLGAKLSEFVLVGMDNVSESLYFFYIVAYYIFFIWAIIYICKKKKYFKTLVIILLSLLFLSFAGCVRSAGELFKPLF